jgi:hypothetical protein
VVKELVDLEVAFTQTHVSRRQRVTRALRRRGASLMHLDR